LYKLYTWCYIGEMEHVDASEARRSFGSLCRRAGYGGERIVIDYHGNGLAALVPIRDLDTLERLRDPDGPPTPPDRVACLAALRGARAKLRAAGVRRIAVFGSVARGDARPESDVDLLVDFDPKVRVGLVAFVDLRDDLRRLLKHNVDLVSARGLDPVRNAEIFREARYAF